MLPFHKPDQSSVSVHSVYSIYIPYNTLYQLQDASQNREKVWKLQHKSTQWQPNFRPRRCFYTDREAFSNPVWPSCCTSCTILTLPELHSHKTQPKDNSKTCSELDQRPNQPGRHGTGVDEMSQQKSNRRYIDGVVVLHGDGVGTFAYMLHTFVFIERNYKYSD